MYEDIVSQLRKSAHLTFSHEAIHGESVTVFNNKFSYLFICLFIYIKSPSFIFYSLKSQLRAVNLYRTAQAAISVNSTILTPTTLYSLQLLII